MKKHWRMVLAVILCAVLCIGYYYYLANKPSKKDATDKVVQNDELAYLVARNISDNYPESVRDVVKLYARITKEYYDSDISEEDIEKLGHQARLLFDDELKNTQTDELYARYGGSKLPPAHAFGRLDQGSARPLYAPALRHICQRIHDRRLQQPA